jgi:N-acyl-D-amino-acid deacylase
MPTTAQRKFPDNDRLPLLAFLAALVWWPLSVVIASPAPPAIPISGEAQPQLATIDNLMTSFLREENAPGASVAITRNGRLVYARGFGYADRNTKESVTPASLFRIASISKPITAVTVLHLAEQGKIRLDEHPFPELNLPPVFSGSQTSIDPRLAQITVLQLLQHRGGFDRAMTRNPELQSILVAHLCGSEPPATAEQTIRVMEGKPLDLDPGTRYAYSPFGYCVLGRVIERATKQPYEKYVQSEILAPLGIHDMQVGHSLLKDKLPHEVTYYTPDDRQEPSAFPPNVGEPAPAPYGWIYIEAQSSNGGWVATAVDLARLATAFDDAANCPVLRQQSIQFMYAPPSGFTPAPTESGSNAGPRWYGCGWFVHQLAGNRFSYYHGGLLPGSCSLMKRRWDGIDYVILINDAGDRQGQNLITPIENRFDALLGTIHAWPTGRGRGEKWS